MYVKNIKKKAVVFTMAAVLGVAGISGAGVFLAADTPQVAKAAFKNYNVTMNKGDTICLSDIVPAKVLAETNLTSVSNSNKYVVAYSTVSKGKKLVDGQITGLKKGNATLSFTKKQKDNSDGAKKAVCFTLMVKVMK